MKSPYEGGVDQSLPLSARNAQMPERRTAVFCNFVLRQVKSAALRECWLHICFRFNVTGRSCGLRPPRRRAFSPLTIDATAHRCAPVFEVGDLSTEKSDADAGDRQVWEQTGERRFAGLLPCRDQMGHKCSPPWSNAEWKGPDPRSNSTLHISLHPKSSFSGEISTIRP